MIPIRLWRNRWFPLLLIFVAFSVPQLGVASRKAHSQQAGAPQTDAKHQLIPRSQEERERAGQAAHHIFLNVYVTGPAGKQATGLKKTNFSLLVDGKPWMIQQFESIAGEPDVSPAQVILVLDTVNNSAGKLSHFRQEIEKYLNERGAQLANPTSIALVTTKAASITPPSRDRDALRAELKSLDSSLHTKACSDAVDKSASYLPNSGNGIATRDPNPQLDCANRQFNASIKALDSLAEQQGNATARVILIWIGQGWPLLSERGFKPDTPEITESFFRDLVSISSAMTEAQVTLDAIASPNLQHIGAQDTRLAAEVTRDSLSLHALAHQSGGQVLKDTKDIAAEINACVADAESYYVLSFDAPPAATFGEPHVLEVKADDPQLTVRTNTLYYAEQ